MTIVKENGIYAGIYFGKGFKNVSLER